MAQQNIICYECFRTKQIRVSMKEVFSPDFPHIRTFVCINCSYGYNATEAFLEQKYGIPPIPVQAPPAQRPIFQRPSSATSPRQPCAICGNKLTSRRNCWYCLVLGTNGGATEVKYIEYQSLFNDTIVEFRFIAQPNKTWFAENEVPLIKIIKQMIPASEREYNPATFKWQVAEQYWKPLKLLFESQKWTLRTPKTTSAPKVEVPSDYTENFYHNNTPVTTVESTESIAVKLSAFLGVEITTQAVAELKKLYRQKALQLHPDRNSGDGSQMSELNRLWTLYTLQDKVVQ